MSKLKSCPFCGNEAEINYMDVCGCNEFTPKCTVCGCRLYNAMIETGFSDEHEAAKAWNTRTQLERSEGE